MGLVRGPSSLTRCRVSVVGSVRDCFGFVEQVEKGVDSILHRWPGINGSIARDSFVWWSGDGYSVGLWCGSVEFG